MENTNLVPEMQEENLSEQMQVRRGKLKALQDKGQDPFVKTKYEVTDYAKDIVENFNDEEEDHGTGQPGHCNGYVLSTGGATVSRIYKYRI